MKNSFQWIFAIFLAAIAVMLIVFGIAGIAVALGFLMIPAGISFIVKGVQNLSRKSKPESALNINGQNKITINPVVEILIGVLLITIGVSLAGSFIGIALTGVAIYFLFYFLDKTFNKKN